MRELFYYRTSPYSRAVLRTRMWRGVLRPKTGIGFVAYTRGYARRRNPQTVLSYLDPPAEDAGWYYCNPKNLYRFHGPFPSRYAAMIAFLLHTD